MSFSDKNSHEPDPNKRPNRPELDASESDQIETTDQQPFSQKTEPEQHQNYDENTQAVEERSLITKVLVIMSERRSRSKIDRAERTIEKMDRKDKIYHGLGRVAVSSQPKREASLWPQPKTVPERVTSLLIDRKVKKKIEADNNVYRTRKIHGPDKAKPVASVRKTVYDRSVSAVTTTTKSPELGVGESVIENTKRILVGADIKGSTRLKQLFDRAGNRWAFLTGKNNAREARIEATKIKAAPMKFGNKQHRQTRRLARRRNEGFQLATEQPLRSGWRNMRRNRAIGRIQKQHEKIESHSERTIRRKELIGRVNEMAKHVGETSVRTVKKIGHKSIKAVGLGTETMKRVANKTVEVLMSEKQNDGELPLAGRDEWPVYGGRDRLLTFIKAGLSTEQKKNNKKQN